jgi:hypothetical protein
MNSHRASESMGSLLPPPNGASRRSVSETSLATVRNHNRHTSESTASLLPPPMFRSRRYCQLSLGHEADSMGEKRLPRPDRGVTFIPGEQDDFFTPELVVPKTQRYAFKNNSSPILHASVPGTQTRIWGWIRADETLPGVMPEVPSNMQQGLANSNWHLDLTQCLHNPTARISIAVLSLAAGPSRSSLRVREFWA